MRMRAVHWFFFVVFFFGSLRMSNADQPESLKNAEDAARQLVVVIKGELDDGPTMGAGFVFRRERDRIYIATANHVVRRLYEAKHLEVKLAIQPDMWFSAQLISQFSKELDLTVLVVDDLDKHGINPCKWPVELLHKPDSLQRGDNIFHIGHPHGIEWLVSVSPDKVIQIVNGDIIFQTSAISVGHSGGLLLDEDRMTVGMITSDTPSYGRAITIEKVRNTLEQWGYGVQLYTGWSPLYAAVEEGNLNAVRSLTDESCTNIDEVKYVHGQANTPLEKAIRGSHKDIVALLLNKGADPNLETPIIAAIFSPDTEIAALLIEHGADPTSALSTAARNNKPEMLKLLLSAGGAVDYRRSESSPTPLLGAVDQNALLSVEVLLAHGADVDAVRGDSKSSLHIAAYYQRLEVIRKLLKKKPNLDKKDGHGNTPLHLAINNRSYKDDRSLSNSNVIINLLIAAGTNVNIENNSRDSVLQILMEDHNWQDAGWFATFDALLAHGANPNGTGKFYGETPLHKAVKRKSTKVVKRLIKAAADVNIANNFGETVLHILMKDRNWQDAGGFAILDALLDHGANPNVKDNYYGETPLHKAVKNRRSTKLVKRLIKAGARIDIPSKSSRTPLDLARSYPHIIEILTQAERSDPGESLMNHLAPSKLNTKPAPQPVKLKDLSIPKF